MKLFSINPTLTLGTIFLAGLIGTSQGMLVWNSTLFNSTLFNATFGNAYYKNGTRFMIPGNTTNTTVTLTKPLFAAPKTTPPATLPSHNPNDYVFTVVNSHTAPVYTTHGHGFNSPPAIYKKNEGDLIQPNETVAVAVPTGWNGRLAMFEDGYTKNLDRATLLEGSFIHNMDLGTAIISIDVSYVDAFTVPMVCECNGKVILGCNLDLHHICPESLRADEKTCSNPTRDHGGIPPQNIFEDCAQMAYTFPTDDLATHNNIPGCGRSITCCIGTACSPHPMQKLCPAMEGYAQDCAIANKEVEN
ncbi:hypothetical protein M426DRAFT_10596 [Hypoxylon sp. CI-4A]|nr:hypothetical protein M426DRAFT_10596 [Hypoxylon sp. CI-4A]